MTADRARRSRCSTWPPSSTTTSSTARALRRGRGDPARRCGARGRRCSWATGSSPPASPWSPTSPRWRTRSRCRRIVARICGSEISQSADRYRCTRACAATCGGSRARPPPCSPCPSTSARRKADVRPRCAAGCGRLGYCLGMGFQIIDDILDFEGPGADTGKPTGQRPCRRDLHAADHPRPEKRRRTTAGRSCPASWLAPGVVQDRVAHPGDGRHRESAADGGRYTERSLREISQLPCGTPDVLENVAEKLLHRTR